MTMSDLIGQHEQEPVVGTVIEGPWSEETEGGNASAATSESEQATGPVLTGEVLTEQQYQQVRAQRIRARAVQVARSRIPQRYQDRAELQATAKLAGARAARSPKTYLVSVGRGTAASVRAWKRWVSATEFRQAAKESGKLAEKWHEIRHQALVRWSMTGGYAAGGATALGVADLVYGSPALWITGTVTSAALALLGRRKDDRPGRKPVVSERSIAWAMDGEHLQEVFRQAKLVGKDERIAYVRQPRREGAGWLVLIDLPGGKKAATAIKESETLASALAVDEIQLILERVRGKDGHAGRLRMWVADEDPYAQPPARSPLAEATSWDFWNPVPFGTTARGTRVPLSLIWSSLLTGAIPRMGKTYAARLPATGAALDAYVRLIVFDGKGGKDWRPYEQVAHRFGRGDNSAVNRRLLNVLTSCVEDMERRFQTLGDLDDEVCPESKVTPQITRNPDYDMPLTLINIDEVQVYLEDEEMVPTGEVDNNDKPKMRKRGAIICDLLTYIIKKGPASGYMLNLATQKPDSEAIPAKLRDNAGTRLAMKTMTYQASNMILGPSASKAGYDSSKLMTSHKGVGLLFGSDGETDLDAGEIATVRSDMLTIAEIRAACERGREARIAAGTLSGDAVGNTSVNACTAVLSKVEAATATADESSSSQAAEQHEDAEGAGEAGLPLVLTRIAETVEDHERGWVALSELAERMESYEDHVALGNALAEAGHGVGGDSPLTARKRVLAAGERTQNPVSALDLDRLAQLVTDALDNAA